MLSHFAIFFKIVAPQTIADVKACEADSTKMYAYNQCVTWASSCSFIEGTTTAGACVKPNATNTSCIQPGFLLNSSSACVDCRTEDQCLSQCDGFWEANLKVCLRQKNKSFKTSTSGTLCTSYTTAADCNKCRDQRFALNSVSKCVRCPPGKWNSTTMTCTQFSTCTSSSGQGLSSDYGKCIVCYDDPTKKFLDQYSTSCDVCPPECASCGGFTNCLACAPNFSFATDTTNLAGICECKNAFGFNGQFCTACKANCSKCKGDGTCKVCATNYGLNTSNNTCIKCAVFNTTDKTICDIPTLAFCQTLSADGLYCNACQMADQYYDTVAGYCVCTSGKVQNITTGVCSKCSDLFPNCATCNSTNCLSCLDPNFTLNTGSAGCTCTGYISNGQCVQCSKNIANCQACSPDGLTCTQCLLGYGLLSNGQICYSCSTVDTLCIECDGNSKCTKCNYGYVLDKVNNKCICDTSTNLYTLLNGFCYKCSSSILSCNTCIANTTKDGVTCTSCINPYVVVNGQCQLCADGYFKSGNSCQACTQANCTSCTSSDCFKCKTGYTLNNNICSCVSPMIVDVDGICKTCSSKFGSLCATCTISSCSSCNGINYTATSSGCVCQRGVDNLAAQKCVACPANCSTCTSNADFSILTCTLCDSGYKLLSNGNCGNCLSNQYYSSSDKTCKNCNANCSGCADNQGGAQCTGCSNGFVLSAQLTCTCADTKIISTDNVNCVSCSERYVANCATCDQTGCLNCISNYYLNSSNQCIICPDGQYFSSVSKSCITCSTKCTKCTGLTGTCTQCSDNYDPNVQTGVCECANTKILNQSSLCVFCSSIISNCSKCSSLTACQECSSGYKLMSNNQCQQCGAAQYYKTSTKSCQNCPTNCSSCTDDTAQCTGSCTNNYRLDSGACVCNKDRILINGVCKLCSDQFPNCSECNNSACTTCAAPYILTVNGCKSCGNDEIYIPDTKSCVKCSSFIQNCLTCSSTSTCTACYTAPFQVSPDGSTCVCPDGNYLVKATQIGQNDQCISCKSFDSNCQKCSALNVCSVCSNSYAYDSNQKICRQCNGNEYYDNRPSDSIQICQNCNIIHEKCNKCSDSQICTSCSDNYDISKENSCQCITNKILTPDPNNPNSQICKLCSNVIDPQCQLCDTLKECSQCLPNYRWDALYNRCLPDISITITNQNKKENLAIVDFFNLQIIIPQSFQSAALKLNIYYYDSIDQYNTEVAALQSQKVPDDMIPFSLKDCVVYTQDNLNTLPHPKYTKVTLDGGVSYVQKRIDSFVLHDNTVRFIYTVESQNSSFLKYSGIIDISSNRVYKNIKDLSFQINKNLSILSPFSLYNIFYQISTQNKEICTSDEQCNGNGTCSPNDKMCKCNQDFKLFDCSDYVTFSYDKILEKIGKTLLVKNPVSYQEKIVSQNVPLLITATAPTSQAGVLANLKAVKQIVQNEIIDNNQREDLENLMQNIMNSVSKNIKELGTDFTPYDIINTIRDLEQITQDLLVNFDNVVSFTTPEIQLLAKISRDPTRLITTVNTKNIFNINYDTSGSLFEPTTYESVGLQIKMLRYAFKINPHKLSNPRFKDQPRYYPLIIYHTFRQPSTIKRVLESSAPLVPFQLNITFTFDVYNPSQLKNLICLSLSDLNKDEYALCNNIQILTSQVICICQNSATLYEDINYNYLPKPSEEDDQSDKPPLSMVITIIVLSVLLALLLIVQIRGRKSNRSSAKLDEAYAKSRAAAIARKRQQETEQNPMVTEMKDLRKQNVHESNVTANYNMISNKSEDFRIYDTVFGQQPIINNSQRNVKLIIGGNQGNKSDEESPGKEILFQEPLDFYGDNKVKDTNKETPQPKPFDPNMVATAMEQNFDDKSVENKEQRGSVLKFEEEEEEDQEQQQ